MTRSPAAVVSTALALSIATLLRPAAVHAADAPAQAAPPAPSPVAGLVQGGKVRAGTKTEAFMKASKVPVHVPLSGRTMEFDANGKCVVGC